MKSTHSPFVSYIITTAAALSVVAAAASAEAGSITFSGSNGSLAAQVKFEDVGNQLIVTLTNTSLADVLVPSNVLTGVFFDSSDVTLTRVSAVLAAGSVVFYGGTDPGNVVGGEWAYRTASFAGVSQNSGISSSGLGSLFGPPDRFPGNDLQSPTSPDGLQYGITSAGDDLNTGNTPVTGEHALIKNSVVFTLGGWNGGDVSLAEAISNIRFQYGTAIDEGDFRGIPDVHAPEPASMVLTGTGLLALARSIRRKKAA